MNKIISLSIPACMALLLSAGAASAEIILKEPGVIIAKSDFGDKGSGTMNWSGEEIVCQNEPLDKILVFAWESVKGGRTAENKRIRVIDNSGLPKEKYNLSVSAEKDELWDKLAGSLGKALGVNIAHGKRMMKSYVLTRAKDIPLNIRKIKSDPPGEDKGWSIMGTAVEIEGCSMDEFAELLEEDWHPAVDETGIEGEYSFNFNGDMKDYDALNAGLKSVGLELVKGEREIEAIYIEKAK